MTRILFIRHSKTKANQDGISQSDKLDLGLTQEGINIVTNKAQQIIQENYNFKIAYITPTSRAKQTLDEFIKVLNQKPKVVTDKLLAERSFGSYDGKPFSQLMEAFDNEGPNPKGVEPVNEFVERVSKAVNRIINSKVDEDILVISHSNVIGVMYCLLYKPERVETYWQEYETPSYCEGFEYKTL